MQIGPQLSPSTEYESRLNYFIWALAATPSLNMISAAVISDKTTTLLQLPDGGANSTSPLSQPANRR